MKKILIFLAVAAVAAAANSGCDVDTNFHSPLTIDNIPVEPDHWQRAINEDGFFDHYYCDVTLLDITEEVLLGGALHTYLVSGPEGDATLNELPDIVTREKYVDNEWTTYVEILDCSYSLETIRFTIRRMPVFDGPPDKTLYFQTKIFR